MRAFVTGADGFVGQWLLRRLLANRDIVTGMIRSAQPSLTTLDASLASRVAWRSGEITDGERIQTVLRECKPEQIFHLAALSSVPASIDDPLATVQVNVMGTVELLQAVRACSPDSRVLVVGSSDAYGAVSADELPLKETSPLRPLNPYAASKAAAELAALQFAQTGWVNTIVTRSFNHTGPGQHTTFAVPSFAKQIAAMKAGKQEHVLRAGDLSPRRDLTDVRDVVEAYVLLAERGTVGGVYNVCSGRDYSIREVVDALAQLAGISIEIRQDPALLRPVDTPVLRGDPSRIAADTGWRPAIPLQTTLADLLEYFEHA